MARTVGLAVLTLLLLFVARCSAAQPAVELIDEERPLQEIRPLDRHVYILTLEGKWLKPLSEADETPHYINLLFDDGKSVSNRVQNEEAFRKGEIRCVIQEYELIRHQVDHGGTFRIVISAKRQVESATDPRVLSDVFTVHWPLQRPIVTRPPHTRHTPPEPVDAFPRPDDALLHYPRTTPPPAKK